MTDIIDLNQRRNELEQPASGCIKRDEYGRPLYLFGYEFDHLDGKQYGFHIWAYNREDAEAKLASIKATAFIYGQVYDQIPA